LALAASGLNGQNFAFVGYLPQDSAARTQRLRELENLTAKHGQTQIFIETPYRNQALWDALVHGLQGNTRLARASGLTLASMQVHCKTVQAWRSSGKAHLSGEPTVFLMGK
jgi:16S rRNA (cytidine1402-2'-O)-methyltransferase